MRARAAAAAVLRRLSPPFAAFRRRPCLDKVRSYARGDAPGQLRRKDEKRKAEREARKERKALERLKKEEELRRLKNLKASELHRRLEEIASMAGAQGGAGFDAKVGGGWVGGWVGAY